MNEQSSKTQGVHHVGLTVPNVASSCAFFIKALGFSQIGGEPDYPAVYLSDGTTMITLWQAKDPARAKAFDRHHNIGLHHLALKVNDAEDLDRLNHDLSDRSDTNIEFPPEPLGSSRSRHMMCRIPGNIRLELISS